MIFPEIYTLIIGVLIIGTLTIIYLRYYFKNIKIKKAIVYGSKAIKRVHYLLKHNGYKIIDVNREYKYTIISKEQKIIQKFIINIIAKKSGKKYAIFYNTSSDMQIDVNFIDEKILFKLLLTKIRHCAIILPDLYLIKEFKISC